MSGHDIPFEDLAQAHATMHRLFNVSIQGLLTSKHNDTVTMALEGRRVAEMAMRDMHGDERTEAFLDEQAELEQSEVD